MRLQALNTTNPLFPGKEKKGMFWTVFLAHGGQCRWPDDNEGKLSFHNTKEPALHLTRSHK